MQIRPWQEDINYIVFVADARNIHNIKKHLFYLTHKQMMQEALTNAHRKNSPEKRLSINVDSSRFDFWMQNYLMSLEDLKEKVKNV